MLPKLVKRTAFSIGFAMIVATPSLAQSGPFSPMVRVNDNIITKFEVDQRILMLQAFGSSGDLQQIAIDGLIEDRIRTDAAKKLGISVDEDALYAGMEEFAARGSLTVEQLTQYLGARKVDETTFRDFVKAGLVFRDVVSAKFGRSANVTEDEIDTRLNLQSSTSISVLMSELLMPNNERGDAKTMELATSLSNSISTRSGFESAARKYSRSASARRGGKLDWVEIANLPPLLSGQIMALEEGEITAPIRLSGAVGLFQLRGIRETQKQDLAPLTISYANVAIPAAFGDTAKRLNAAKDVLNAIDTCADLRAESERFGENSFEEHVLTRSEIPGVLATSLAGLDRNEATILQNQDTSSILMVCNRVRDLPDADREGLRNALVNQRITGFGNGYLQELKGKAFIQEQ